MLKRTISVLSKAAALPSVRFDVGSILLNNLQKRTFSSVWKVHAYQSRNLTLLRKCAFASQPSHTKMAMPALSPTMEQGNIIKWNFKEGDKVEVGQAVCDIETDKATLGFELQDAGYVAKILVPEGTKGVKVGTPIFILVDEAGDVKAFADYKGESASEQPQQTKQAEPKEKEQPKQPKEQEQKAPAKSPAHHVSENIRGHHRDNVRIRFTHGRGNQGAEAHGHAGHAGERVLASPFARKIAKEKGIDLSQVSGSGPHGRILAHDVQSFTPKPAVKETAEKAAPTAAPKDKAAPAPATGVQNPYTDIQLSNVREIIAKRLLQSKTTIPHYYLKMEIVMDNAIEIRENLNKESKHKISFNDMFIKAASLACVAVPEVNSQWHDTFIRKFKNADISVAVDTGSGLITPIVFAANTKGLSEIAQTTKQLIEKAKASTLKPQEFQGGTFSISNLGMLGVSRFSAVINPPQSCILAVGKTGKKLVDQGGIKEVNVMEVVLSCDHRVVDGAVGARWLQAFKNYLEKPLTMLL